MYIKIIILFYFLCLANSAVHPISNSDFNFGRRDFPSDPSISTKLNDLKSTHVSAQWSADPDDNHISIDENTGTALNALQNLFSFKAKLKSHLMKAK